MKQRLSLMLYAILICFSMFAINVFAGNERLGMNQEEVIFSIDNPSNYATSNYSYPAYLPFGGIYKNNTFEIYKNLFASNLFYSGIFDFLISDGIYGTAWSMIKSTNLSLSNHSNFNNSYAYVRYLETAPSFISALSSEFDIGITLGSFNYSDALEKRVFTVSNSITPLYYLNLNQSAFTFYVKDLTPFNVSINHFNSTQHLRFRLDSNNLTIEQNSSVIYTSLITLSIVSIDRITLGYFTLPSFLGIIHQFHASYIPMLQNLQFDINPIFEPYEIESALFENMVAYKSKVFTFSFNLSLYSTPFNFAALFSIIPMNARIIFTNYLNNTNYKEISRMKGVLAGTNLNQFFQLLNVNQTYIATYNSSLIERRAILPSTFRFDEITIISDNDFYLKGWSSNYNCSIFPFDHINTTFSLSGLFQSQPIKKVNEFHEPIAGYLNSRIFGYYGTVNYSGNQSTAYNSDIFIADSTNANSMVYLQDNKDMFLILSGRSGTAYINYEESNQSRNYCRVRFSQTNVLFKAEIAIYEIEERIVRSSSIQSVFPIQLEFFFNASSHNYTLTNFNNLSFNSSSVIGLRNEGQSVFVVLDEAPYNQTFSNSSLTRNSIELMLNKDFSYMENNSNLLFSRLVHTNFSVELINSNLNSAGISAANNYSNIEAYLNGDIYALNSKIGTTVGALFNYDKMLSAFMFHHLKETVQIESIPIRASSLSFQNPAQQSAIRTLLPFLAPITAVGINFAVSAYSGGTAAPIFPYMPSNFTEFSGAVDTTIDYISNTTVNLALDGMVKELMIGLSSILNSTFSFIGSAITDMFLAGIEMLNQTFFTKIQDIFSDFVGFSNTFSDYAPTTNQLSIWLYSQAFLQEGVNSFKVMLNSVWLLSEISENQTVLSYLIALGVSALLFFVIPFFLHLVKRNATITYIGCIISAMLLGFTDLMPLGMALIALGVSVLLLINHLRKGGNTL